ncbi:MAG: UpxY family transcription antiterminator [Bacteroidales bacterium]|nr:UpxY family transcription antiterminator [Bacteroidales bacterium]MBR6279302.1 UpxY family transcription antiterminator [Bacteroidales bacterium]
MWIPIKTVYMNELKVESRLNEMDLETFIPKCYAAPDLAPADERIKYPLVPAVHNLIFVKKDYDRNWCLNLRKELEYPVNFIKKDSQSNDYATIKDEEMARFINFCNPLICGTIYKTPEEIRLKAGEMVRIKKGEFEGITGKFVRYQKHHYIAIETLGLCALLKIKFTEVEKI